MNDLPRELADDVAVWVEDSHEVVSIEADEAITVNLNCDVHIVN